MATRYVIVSLLPPQPDQALRAWYHSLTGQPVPIQHLHLTLVPTFYLQHDHHLDQIKIHLNQTTDNRPQTTAFTFSPPAFFTGPDKKSILHLPVIPEKPLSDLSDHLIHQLADYLNFDLSIYQDQKLPPYTPHITLNYNFPPDLQPKAHSTPLPKNIPFTLNPPVILQEHPDLSWKII